VLVRLPDFKLSNGAASQCREDAQDRARGQRHGERKEEHTKVHLHLVQTRQVEGRGRQ
jgi:hypothetical protein